jgi:ABC-type dipeptide/oligopeptide/nickel transport system permease subunit
LVLPRNSGWAQTVSAGISTPGLSMARSSMEVAILANIVSTIIGIIIGAVAGFFGGVVDMALMRFTDVMMSFPIILFAAFIAVVFEPGMAVLILIIVSEEPPAGEPLKVLLECS